MSNKTNDQNAKAPAGSLPRPGSAASPWNGVAFVATLPVFLVLGALWGMWKFTQGAWWSAYNCKPGEWVFVKPPNSQAQRPDVKD